MPSRLLLSIGTIAAALAVAGPAQALQISEARFRGPSGANDEFVELYNDSDTALVVSTTDGSSGWSVVTNDGTVRFTVPNGTSIPARGHYLGANSVAYSLGSTATADITFNTDMPDNAGVAVFRTATAGNFTLANRLDAVGFTSTVATLYKEGTGLPALTPFSIDSSFYRDTRPGLPKDTGANASDLLFVDTNGTSAGAGQRLGAPGPQNKASAIAGPGDVVVSLFDPSVSATGSPNLVNLTTSDSANNATFGRLLVRRRLTNLTSAPLTGLAVRVVDLTTFPSPSGISDLRPQSAPSTVTVAGRTVIGASLTGPSQPNGGGFNSVLTVPAVTASSPLLPGDSVDVQFQMGIQQDGAARFCAQVEAVPSGNGLLDVVTTAGAGTVPTSQCSPAFARATVGPLAAPPTFADELVGRAGAAQTVTFTNTNGVAAKLGKVEVTGDDFLVTGDGCSQLTPSAGATCTVRVRFAPSAAGPRAATLRILGDVLPSSSVALVGTGTVPDVAAPIVGPAGATGATGAAGPAGATGPAGAPAKVSCTTKKQKKSTKVTCDITVQAGATKASLKTRSGKVLATATIKRGRLIFTTKKKVPAGGYVVRIDGGPKLTATVG